MASATIVAALLVSSTVPAHAQIAAVNLEAIVSMTGQAAFSGQANAQTLAAFEKYTNANGGVRGAQIHFNVTDDQTSPQVSLQLANAAIAKKAPVIFGSTVVATCASVGAAVATAGPVQYCFSPGYSPPKDAYSFALGAPIKELTRTFLKYAQLRGFHRLAVVVSTDATGVATTAVIDELLRTSGMRGLSLVAEERVSTGDVSATAQAAKIKAARPDVMITTTSGTVFSTVVHGLFDVGLDVPVLTTTANASAPQLKQLADWLPNELTFNGLPFQLADQLKDSELRRQARAFFDAFKGIGVEPSALHALAWDSLLLAIAAYRQFGPSLTADQLRTFTLSQRHFPGLNGFYNFTVGDQHGLDSNSVVMIGWDKTKQDFFPASDLGGIPRKR